MLMHGRGGQAVRWTKHSADSVLSPYRHTAPRMSTDHAQMASSEIKEACFAPPAQSRVSRDEGGRGCTLPSTPTGCTTVHLAHISWVRTWTNRVMIRHEPHAKVDVDLDLTATLDPHLIILLPQRVLLVHQKFRPHTRILNFF
jgi:hypothetical protein